MDIRIDHQLFEQLKATKIEQFKQTHPTTRFKYNRQYPFSLCRRDVNLCSFACERRFSLTRFSMILTAIEFTVCSLKSFVDNALVSVLRKNGTKNFAWKRFGKRMILCIKHGLCNASTCGNRESSKKNEKSEIPSTAKDRTNAFFNLVRRHGSYGKNANEWK